jgi:hypothetical protein
MEIYMTKLFYLNHCYEQTSYFDLISMGDNNMQIFGIIIISLIW